MSRLAASIQTRWVRPDSPDDYLAPIRVRVRGVAHSGTTCSTSSKLLRFLRRISAIIAWSRMAGIGDFRLAIGDLQLAIVDFPAVAG